jgi:hypothetical protein
MVIDGKPALLGNPAAPLSRYLDDFLESFRLAAWCSLVTRYDTPNQCVRLCVTGARLLSQMPGVKAEAVFCELWGMGGTLGRFGCGISFADLVADAAKEGMTIGADDVRMLNCSDGVNIHMVIRVKYKNEYATIDPTLCQLWPVVSGLPASLVLPGKDWPYFQGDGFRIQYREGRIAERYKREAQQTGFSKGLHGDMQTLMMLVGTMGNDADLFFRFMRANEPELMAPVNDRVARWMVRA